MEISEKTFQEIFEYGNENSGTLMFNLFKKMGLDNFVISLCDIDLWKWKDYWKGKKEENEMDLIMVRYRKMRRKPLKDAIRLLDKKEYASFTKTVLDGITKQPNYGAESKTGIFPNHFYRYKDNIFIIKDGKIFLNEDVLKMDGYIGITESLINIMRRL